jgi:ferritin-like metal-binding protein YciE
MSKINSFKELLLLELRDLYDAEARIEKALPKMAEAAESPDLQQAFTSHLEETREQVERLEKAFDILGERPKGETCEAAKGLIKEGEEIIKNIDKGTLRDAGLIGAAQRVEHYEMAGYGTARNFARVMGQTEIVKLLDTTLQEEGEADKKLNKIAQTINKQAVNA